MSGHIAAQIARDAATGGGGVFLELSALMCWDAVIRCQVKAGGQAPGDHGVSMDDTPVNNPDDMRHVPQGAAIGFFEGGTLIHAMLATGHGLAAGNKNACIGIGGPVGWEILDLAGGVTWTGGRVQNPQRLLEVRYRSF